jgi:ferredoxin-nitrite reductase
VWQSLIISDITADDEAAVRAALVEIGLPTEVSPLRAAFVACTGNTGCRFAASDTKRHALESLEYLERRVALDTPINVHLTGCPNSCAQHHIADIGLLGAKVPTDGEAEVEGYHIFLGGGYGERRELAREVMRDVPHTELPQVLERLLRAYLAHRTSVAETFQEFAKRHSPEALLAFAGQQVLEAA